MVTGVAGSSTMTTTVATAGAMPSLAKEAPIKSDRRSNKPIMEKRRRARINNCLNELKTLILDYSKKDPSRHSKLEKADILEKTVKHLQELQRQQAAMQQASDPKTINKFKAGFTECANEVSRFPGLEPAVKRRLLQHLSNCINGVKTELHHHHQQQQQQQQQLLQQQQLTLQQQQLHHVNATQTQQMHAHMLPSPPSSPEQDPHSLHQQQQLQQHMAAAAHPYIMSAHIKQTPNGYFLPNGLQVIPTKLPNGSIALVLPQSMPHQQPLQHQQPMQQMQMPNQAAMLMSMPTRTASTGSASSHSSAGYELAMAASPSSSSANNSMHHYAPPSPANSYEAMDCKPSVIQHCSQQQQPQPQPQQPLSLVMKKNIKEEDQPWRPW